MKSVWVLALVIGVYLPLRAQQAFSVMSYNIENAFDTIHDAGKMDAEY